MPKRSLLYFRTQSLDGMILADPRIFLPFETKVSVCIFCISWIRGRPVSFRPNSESWSRGAIASPSRERGSDLTVQTCCNVSFCKRENENMLTLPMANCTNLYMYLLCMKEEQQILSFEWTHAFRINYTALVSVALHVQSHCAQLSLHRKNRFQYTIIAWIATGHWSPRDHMWKKNTAKKAVLSLALG